MDEPICTKPRQTCSRGMRAALAVAAIAAISAATLAASSESRSAAFAAENAAAMARMMSAMDVPPSGDVDRDFATMMIAHHQGAVDMARAEIRYGRNDRLRRIAQGIVVAQPQEIAAMRLAIDETPSNDASTLSTSGRRTP